MGWLGGLFGGGGGGFGSPGGGWPEIPMPTSPPGSIGFPFPTGNPSPNAPPKAGTWDWGGPLFNPQNLLMLGSGILSNVLNRPKSPYSKEQQAALAQIIASLGMQAGRPASVNPAERSALYGQAAETARGAQERGLSALAGRGLSSSGIAADYIGSVGREQQRAQTGIDLSLNQSAQGRHQQDIQNYLASLGIQGAVPQGQSVGGAVAGGIAPMLALIIRLNQLQSGASGSGSGNNINNLLPLLMSMGGRG